MVGDKDPALSAFARAQVDRAASAPVILHWNASSLPRNSRRAPCRPPFEQPWLGARAISVGGR